MKVNWSYLKKPSVIIGAIVLFFVILFLMNRSASSATTTAVSTGPSDAQVAAQTQLAMAQIGAGVQGQSFQVDYAKAQDANQTSIALATIAAASDAANTAAQQAIASQTVAAQVHGLDLQYQTSIANNNAQIAAMQVQANYGLASAAINANTTIQLSADQLKAYGYGAITQAIGSAKAGDRDQLTAAFIGAMSGQGVSYGIPGAKGSVVVAPSGQSLAIPAPQSGQSGFNFLNVISPVSGLA
jgi:hypothetical protein